MYPSMSFDLEKLLSLLPKGDPLPESEIEEQKELLGGRTSQLGMSTNAIKVISKRYLLTNQSGLVVETPEEMFLRVAIAVAEGERGFGTWKEDEFVSSLASEYFQELASMRFTPGGRTLANAGAKTAIVANCVVLHIDDTMEDIFQTLKDAALLQKAGCGLGFPLHLMRPTGYVTKASGGTSSGPVSFLHIYNTAFGVIKQQNRHGANMAVMRVDHPDILEFIHCKDVEGNIANFNVSVGITDDFMEQVKSESLDPWMCQFNGEKILPRRIEKDSQFNTISITPVEMTAKQIFKEIVDCGWNNGEPGYVFLDTVNKVNPVPGLGRIEACNPCGEQFLHDGDVCNLGSINLSKFVTPDRRIDYEALNKTTTLAIRFLDTVIDISDFPIERLDKNRLDNRRIGLGIMGFADMLFKLRIGYNTQEGFSIANQVMGFIQEAASKASVDLGGEKGSFGNYDISIFKDSGRPRRNCAVTNIAPTGTIGLMHNVSGGVEPHFALSYHYKHILGGNVKVVMDIIPEAKNALVEAGICTERIIKKIVNCGSMQGIKEIPSKIRKVFVTSMDISAEDHIKMQATFQKHCDNAISKTINFPETATKEDISRGFMLAWESGCKGCTVYRHNSRFKQVLNLNSNERNEDEKENAPIEGETNSDGTNGRMCGLCGALMIPLEGCYTCMHCGNSLCDRTPSRV